MTFGNVAGIFGAFVMFGCNQCDMLLCSLKNIRATAMIRTRHHTMQLKHEQDKIRMDEIDLVEYFMGPELIDDVEKQCDEARKLKPVKQLAPGLRQDTYLPELKNELSAALVDCIRHHEVIINYVKLLETFTSTLVLIKSLQMTLELCNIMYTFFSVKFESWQQIRLANNTRGLFIISR